MIHGSMVLSQKSFWYLESILCSLHAEHKSTSIQYYGLNLNSYGCICIYVPKKLLEGKPGWGIRVNSHQIN